MVHKEFEKAYARLDFLQSFTGAVLAFFIVGHILFEASILVSPHLMYQVTLFFEGYYFFGEKYPGIISFLAAALFVLLITHAIIALRKFPSSYRQYKMLKSHTKSLGHEDSSLWLVQVITGFMLFFLAPIHLYMMLVAPSQIGPFLSSQRVVDGMMAPLYALLLFSVVLHAFIGLYRLALKWGFFREKKAKQSRVLYKKILKYTIAAYLLIGFASLAKYTYIGLTHDYEKEPRYLPHAKTPHAKKEER